MEKYILGIDVGTTSTKTILFSSEKGMLANASMSYRLMTPSVGYSEQNADDWWRAVVKTVRTVCTQARVHEQVSAISLSVQGGTLVPVDEHFCQLRPAIVWNDSRCVQEEEDFQKEFGEEYIYKKTGWKLNRGSCALDVLWIRRNEPGIFERTVWFLSVADYISAKMTGVPAVDYSNAGINQFMDINRGCYEEKILDFIGIAPDRLGKLVQTGEIIGSLTSQAAKELELSPTTLLIAGAHDQYAVAAGAGCSKAGDVLIGTGTAWVVTALSQGPDFSTGFSQSVAATGGLWGSLVSLSNGGVCLDWFRSKISPQEGGAPLSYEKINEMAEKSGIGAKGGFYYPQGAFIGLDFSQDRYDMARAIMEGVAFQITKILERFRDKFFIKGLKLSGGAVKSQLWCQILADVTNLPIKIPEIPDLACVGAALLAGLGSGIYTKAEIGYRHLGVHEREILPDPKEVSIYARLMHEYWRKEERIFGIE